ncbi:MAG TPA: MmgE/PrpD family protein [Burkholderiales bacterium]|nr:MmgE/PrpD family protein [Burkholderiales bacterium]
MGAGLTAAYARFVADPQLESVPVEASELIRSGFVDLTATMIAGRNEPVVAILHQHIRARTGAAEASLLLARELASSPDAALLNATAGHALDYDDVALSGHPSTVLVPAILAEGERLRASGADVIRAYLIGYEVWADLAARERDPYHEKGWHPTAVLGVVGAAAAVAHLAHLDAAHAQNALGLAASMAAGLVANFGSMAKPFHAGRAASAAIEAARLAAAGMTSAPDAIEHRAGLLAALSPRGDVDRETPPAFGRELRLLKRRLSIKKYPACYATHRVIDAVLDLAEKHRIDPGDVRAMTATVGRTQASMLRNHRPQTGLEAKFSLEFAAAAPLVANRVGLAELQDDFVQQPRVQQLLEKVSVRATDTRCAADPLFAESDRVVIELRDGRKLDSGEVRFPRGHAELPLREEELARKFFDCARGAGGLDAERLYGRLRALHTVADVRELVS